MNRLAEESSPYLRQHAENPVDWYPWGEEALRLARREDRPIFLSVGYSACHWCHVMAHESFEDPETASFLNAHFVCVKLDREERPDLDALYMRAVQMLTGSGGWPLSVFLTPGLVPFFGGTYFPPEPRYGMPSFLGVLHGVEEAYRTRRKDIIDSGSRIFGAVRASFEPDSGRGASGECLASEARRVLIGRLDPRRGGFGRGPKFPQPALLRFMLDASRRDPEGGGREEVLLALRSMEAGGIRDQVGGGFHRYSVDGEWRVPHFEKMLYDNAQLASLYFVAQGVTGDPSFGRVGEEVLADLGRSMAAEGGGFIAALDADSEGREGAFYLWGLGEWRSALGSDAPWMARLFGVSERGNFEGANIPYRAMAWEEMAGELAVEPEEVRRRAASALVRLRDARGTRVPPGADTKVLTDWNALAATAYADGYLATGSPEMQAVAQGTLDRIWERCWDGAVLHHVWDGSTAKVGGFLSDYAALALAELKAYEADGLGLHLERLALLLPALVARFGDGDTGLLYESPEAPPEGAEGALPRIRDASDGVLPSGIAMALQALDSWVRMTSDGDLTRAVERALEGESGTVASSPGEHPLLAELLDFRSRPRAEVVVASPAWSAEARALLEVARRVAPPGSLVLPLISECVAEAFSEGVPLFRGRRVVEGAARAYPCTGASCAPPTSDPAELERILGGGSTA